MSLPLRECGLKSLCYGNLEYGIKVTPLAGVWIEIKLSFFSDINASLSLPLRECGLKSFINDLELSCIRHSPCGSVD